MPGMSSKEVINGALLLFPTVKSCPQDIIKINTNAKMRHIKRRICRIENPYL
jgi:hypothetical protein